MKRILLKDYYQEFRLFNRRIILLALLIILCSLSLIARLVYLQVIHHSFYTTLSKQNQLTLLPIEPNRGLIFDRNGILLAENLPIFNLEIIPEKNKQVKGTVKEIAKIIHIDDDDLKQFFKQIREQRRFQPATLRTKLSEEEVAALSVQLYRFSGVAIKTHLVRHYPFNHHFAHIIGYASRINQQELKQYESAGYLPTDFVGKIGIEKYYETILHGKLGYQQVETNANGRMIRELHRIPPVSGHNLYLTIDANLQRVAYKVLNGYRAAMVAINPQNGEILAMVSTPSYDPNLFVTGINSKTYRALQDDWQRPLYNRAVRGMYPPGSTIKPFMAAIGLDSETIDEDYRIHDPGRFYLPHSSHVYRDWELKGHGIVNITRAIMVSCDIFFYQLGLKLGIRQINEMLKTFGFGQKTNIDMSEESIGVAPSPEWKRRVVHQPWYPGDTVITSIGQGFNLVTMVQLANATATIANRGKHFKPHLLFKQDDQQGHIIYSQPVPLNAVPYKEETWDIVIDGMKQVISNPQGTAAYRFGMDTPYSVAAKTGTAQVIRKTSDKDTQHMVAERFKNHSLFIVFAPIEKPQIALAIIVENNPGGFAKVAARKILDYYFLKKEPIDESNQTTTDTVTD